MIKATRTKCSYDRCCPRISSPLYRFSQAHLINLKERAASRGDKPKIQLSYRSLIDRLYSIKLLIIKLIDYNTRRALR